MKLLLEQSETVFDLPEKGALYIGNDEECQVQINHPEIWGQHAVIKSNDYGLVLQVESEPVVVNDIPIKSACLLYPGDVLTIADLQLRLVDDQYIAKAIKATDEFNESPHSEEVSSVFGLRHLTGELNGGFIKSGYRHPQGWQIVRNGSRMALLTHNQPVFVNGQQVEDTWLDNGDRIFYHSERLGVECPGHSGFSKFSPSHPRNVMLSEALNETESAEHVKPSIKTHFWWITLVIGLLALTAVILSK